MAERQFEMGALLVRGCRRAGAQGCEVAPAGRVLSLCLLIVCSAVQCTSASRPELPPGSPFAKRVAEPESWFTHGAAVGEVTSTSAHVWIRTASPVKVELQWRAVGEASALPKGGQAVQSPWRSTVVETDPGRDLTALATLEPLTPGTVYEYRARLHETGMAGVPAVKAQEMVVGQFTAAPAEQDPTGVTFVWSSDLGGQGHCRQGAAPYSIFDRMGEERPAFAVLLGDLIYADDLCPVPPNAPGGQFVAERLDQFRAKHRYQREAPALQRFLSSVPVYVTWDDHEVRNNFSGPYEDLTAAGLRAFLDYWPVRTPLGEPRRLHRQVRYGKALELFMLDTRQYRSRNSDLDGMGKTMLGEEQREWLLQALNRSTATWKVIASSVPLSIPKGGTLLIPGNDSWARGEDGTGFHQELKLVVDVILARKIRNVVWLAGDVHFAQVNTYDPDKDGKNDFYEFVSGPLSAGTREAVAPVSEFQPTTVFSQGGYANYGVVSLTPTMLRLRIMDGNGRLRFERTFEARPPAEGGF